MTEIEFIPGPAFKIETDGIALEGQRLAAQYILQLSNDRVPLEEGTLERSGQVTDNGVDQVVVSYDTPYAARQHEDMTFRHDAGRSAKYLETAMHEGSKQAVELIAAAVRKQLGT